MVGTPYGCTHIPEHMVGGAVQHCEYTVNYRTVRFKVVTFMLYKLNLHNNKKHIKTKQKQGKQPWETCPWEGWRAWTQVQGSK